MANTQNVWKEVNELVAEKTKFQQKTSYKNLSKNQFEIKMKAQFNHLLENFPTIFNKTLDGTMDMERLQYMLSMLNLVNTKEMTQHDASVAVGEKLANAYVKPVVDKMEDET